MGRRNQTADQIIRTIKHAATPAVRRAVMTRNVKALTDSFPWPASRPNLPVNFAPTWFSPHSHGAALRKWMPDKPFVIVELGSFLGSCAHFLATTFPSATIICVDTWNGSAEHVADPNIAKILPTLKQQWLANLWPLRSRIIPLQMTTTEGLDLLAARGVIPDLIYVDADHSTDAVYADVIQARRLFPTAVICGDDYPWDSVREGLVRVDKDTGLDLADRHDACWRLRQWPTRSVKPVITVSAYNRADYAHMVIGGLTNCRHIENYFVQFFVEPGCPEVATICRNFDAAASATTVHKHRLGCNYNIFTSLNYGFMLSDFAIHIEDDTWPAPDFLQFVEWAREQYRNDGRVFSITGYERAQPTEDNKFDAKLADWFHPWGWATWRDRWIDTINHHAWPFPGVHTGWDETLSYCVRKTRFECRPAVARIQNIGLVGSGGNTQCNYNPHGIWTEQIPEDPVYRATDEIVFTTRS